jgi:RNA polymerase sigma-70 factor (ECF subfamily)
MNIGPAEECRSGIEEGNDAELMQRTATGDVRAFDALVRRHLPRAIRMARHILGSSSDAEDIAQESFLRIWKHAADWRSAEEAGALFTTWLYRVVLNLCIDLKRKRTFSSLDDVPEPVDARGNAETNLHRRQQSERVRRAIGALPERQRAAFVLCFYEERSNKEAADILGVSLKAVESLLVRARKQLQRDLLPGERL